MRSQVAGSFRRTGGGLEEPPYASLPPIASSNAYDSSTAFFKNILAPLPSSTSTKSEINVKITLKMIKTIKIFLKK
jgi:hypothetical protein